MSDDKLRDLLKTMGSKLLGDDEDEAMFTEKRRIVSLGSSSAYSSTSDGSVIVNKGKYDQKLSNIQDEAEEVEIEDTEDEDEDDQEEEQPLRIKTKTIMEDEDEEDDFNDYVIDPPLPPPKELDPGKLYALYEFSGDDPSHCELDRDDAVFLLNDQDSYWWLVKKEFDGKIGFAPAECLETYHERLARLNCWKNEELEKKKKLGYKNYSQEKSLSSVKVNKSVSFSDSVLITDEFENKNDHSDSEEEAGYDDEDYREELTSEYEQESNYDDDYDFANDPNDHSKSHLNLPASDMDEFASTSDNFPIIPLSINKRSTNNDLNTLNVPQGRTRNMTSKPRPLSGSDFDDSPLVAPTAFFSINNNTSGSIGTYSPSSSEFDSPGNTPPLTQFKKAIKEQKIEEYERRGNIPQSKGTTDMFQSIRMLDEIINDGLNQSNSEVGADDTLTYDDEDNEKLSSPISLDEEKKNLSNITNSTYTNSNTSLHITSSTTSVDNDETTPSSNSDTKESRTSSTYSNMSTPKRFSTHPEIEGIFKDSLSRMDELAEKLRLLDEQFN